MKQDLTTGSVTGRLLTFAAPLIIGNILQQIYSITDTLIVGRFLGSNALAAVGSTYTLTTFLYSVIIGMCMGSGGLISYYHGSRTDNPAEDTHVQVVGGSFTLILGVSMLIGIFSLIFVRGILSLLQTPAAVFADALAYTRIILTGILWVFLYNFYAYTLRAIGNSVVPMYVLAASTVLNVVLDLVFVVLLHAGVSGAAIATVLAQLLAAVLLGLYCRLREPLTRLHISRACFRPSLQKEIWHMAFGASIQQSVMNFGILMIQGLVNSFGAATMAAFTVAVKIDTLAYMPAQEFANAFSLFISQNFGAGAHARIREGIRKAFTLSALFCLLVSAIVFLCAAPLMRVFLDQNSSEIVAVGVHYLRVEGIFYIGIGMLFLFYGYFRGINRPGISLLLTVISLGTRVLLAYIFAPMPACGVTAIWMAIPIGWILADLTGWFLMKRVTRTAT